MLPTTDTSEKKLESIIIDAMLERGWVQGASSDFDRDHAVDLKQLIAFVEATQPLAFDKLSLVSESPSRMKFLHRLQGEVAKRGVIDVLRNGVKDGAVDLDLFYGTPHKDNPHAIELFGMNRFSVTRQMHYSKAEGKLSLDLCLFINGLPVITFELKNSLTKQTVADAVQQYKRDRDPKELLFQFPRCMVHFAVDDHEVRMCTHLKGKDSWFLPFNRGWDDGAGNPPNPNGLKTAYLWEEILTPASLTEIIETYAQVIEEKDDKGKKKRKQIFPRYHQLDVVRKLLAAVSEDDVGKRYLIQHSAGSGKSNSIAWLAHQLVEMERDGRALFGSIIVITDRKVLDKQIRNTIRHFAHVSSLVGHSERSEDLRRFLRDGKKIIITTVQKFPHILDTIGNSHRKSRFAIIIDEAHSSQGGRTSAKMNIALSESAQEEVVTTEDKINQIMESRKMLTNASYFAFTATPKNKTLEIFGEPYPDGDKIKHLPFHSYTMKQAIQEGFILDVLAHYTPIESYYRLTKAVEDDPYFDTKKAKKKLRRYVEGHEHAIRQKAEIMVDHFHDQVMAKRKINGKARGMIITGSIARAIQYYRAVSAYLVERKSPHRAIVAFSGEHQDNGQPVTEAKLNGFQSGQIEKKFREDPYRFLVVAEKFQTGYDEPLLHTMYVDKQLAGIKAVQTLSRLNRAHPQKTDTFVLDFSNDTDTITDAFAAYYRTTVLSDETDPNKLHDLMGDLDHFQVYTWTQIDELVRLFLDGAERDTLDPILDICVAVYKADLDEDAQVQFKGSAKAFTRTYQFLASILPFTNAQWEKLSIFLNFLIPKLPAPEEEDLSKGILESIDMESYRSQVRETMTLELPDQDAEVGPVPTSTVAHKPEPELDRLSAILKTFNEQFGDIDWTDSDRIEKMVFEELPERVAASKSYQNAIKNSDEKAARLEHDQVLSKLITATLQDDTEFFKQFNDNEDFRRFVSNYIFQTTYAKA